MPEKFSGVERAYLTAGVEYDEAVAILRDLRVAFAEAATAEEKARWQDLIDEWSIKEADLRATLVLLKPQFDK